MARHKKPATLPPLQKRILYVAILVLWITGAIWLLLPTASSSQLYLMKLHGAMAMVFLTVFGTLIFDHVPAGWAQNEHRLSGVWVWIACGVLAVTGWGLYYFGGEILRQVTHWSHVIMGMALPLLIYLHVQVKRSKRGLVLEKGN